MRDTMNLPHNLTEKGYLYSQHKGHLLKKRQKKVDKIHYKEYNECKINNGKIIEYNNH